jgi:4,5-DOPA dioxygenase extradiol
LAAAAARVMPSRYAGIFLSHGAPTLPLDDHPAREFLGALGRRLPRPRAIVVVSPHWLTRSLALKAPTRFETWHDFQGFPEALYRLHYRPHGDAVLRDRAALLLQEAGIGVDISAVDARLDHGAWVPLMLMYPQADVPLVQLSMISDTPQRYREIGRALRPLTDDGVLLVGTGGAVHNLGEVDFADGAPVPAWAREFDQWLGERIAAGDWDALCDYRRRAPQAERAHPTEDHFLPLFFASGAGDRAERLHHSFSHGSLGMAAYGFL